MVNRESSFLLQKRSAKDAHAAIRNFTARKVGRAPQRLMGWGVEVGFPTLC